MKKKLIAISLIISILIQMGALVKPCAESGSAGFFTPTYSVSASYEVVDGSLVFLFLPEDHSCMAHDVFMEYRSPGEHWSPMTPVEGFKNPFRNDTNGCFAHLFAWDNTSVGLAGVAGIEARIVVAKDDGVVQIFSLDTLISSSEEPQASCPDREILNRSAHTAPEAQFTAFSNAVDNQDWASDYVIVRTHPTCSMDGISTSPEHWFGVIRGSWRLEPKDWDKYTLKTYGAPPTCLPTEYEVVFLDTAWQASHVWIGGTIDLTQAGLYQMLVSLENDGQDPIFGGCNTSDDGGYIGRYHFQVLTFEVPELSEDKVSFDLHPGIDTKNADTLVPGLHTKIKLLGELASNTKSLTADTVAITSAINDLIGIATQADPRFSWLSISDTILTIDSLAYQYAESFHEYEALADDVLNQIRNIVLELDSLTCLDQSQQILLSTDALGYSDVTYATPGLKWELKTISESWITEGPNFSNFSISPTRGSFDAKGEILSSGIDISLGYDCGNIGTVRYEIEFNQEHQLFDGTCDDVRELEVVVVGHTAEKLAFILNTYFDQLEQRND